VADDVDGLLAEQVAYYKRRAPLYDQWWERTGDWDLGEEFNANWRAEVERVYRALDEFAPTGTILELAGGTGIWTERLARFADDLTVVDAAAETIAINRARLEASGSKTPVDYVEADLFTWRPTRRYDVVSFTFWLSHVPLERFDEFWELVDAAVEPDGRVFFVDNARPEQDRAPGQIPRDWLQGKFQTGINSITDLDAGTQVRTLDNQAFRVVKRYWDPAALEHRLADLGWTFDINETDWAFIYGHGRRT